MNSIFTTERKEYAPTDDRPWPFVCTTVKGANFVANGYTREETDGRVVHHSGVGIHNVTKVYAMKDMDLGNGMGTVVTITVFDDEGRHHEVDFYGITVADLVAAIPAEVTA